MTNTEMKKVLSLNPYYTGIHLHTKKELQRLTEKRLNPYYTGIHLHELFVSALNPLKEGLNPYYTGIHLHYLYQLPPANAECLNPYYTGIHLHIIWILICQWPNIVLILIILEYIYIFA